MDERLQFVASWRAEIELYRELACVLSNDSSCGRGERRNVGYLRVRLPSNSI